MAKRTTSTSNYSTVKTAAFWGVILAGIVGFINLIIYILDWIFENDNWGWAKSANKILNILSTVAIFISIWLAGWDYAKTKSKAWRTIFVVLFIFALLALLGINVLGLLKDFFK